MKLALWRSGMESLELDGLAVLDQVKADGAPSSAVGEGLADALNVGGILDERPCAGLYFDGTTSARHDVTVEARRPRRLRIRGADGAAARANGPTPNCGAVGARRHAAASAAPAARCWRGSRSAIRR